MRILIKNGDVEIANGNPVILSELSKVQLLSARHSFGELPAHASPPFDGASVVVVVTVILSSLVEAMEDIHRRSNRSRTIGAAGPS